MSEDLTKLSRKELESKLAKKYGPEKYLREKSQLLQELQMEGLSDRESLFTGPEAEAVSIMLEEMMSANKAGGGKVNAPREVDIKGQDHMLAYITPEEGGLLQLMGGAGKPGPMGIPSFFDTGESDYDNQQSYQDDYESSYGDSSSDASGQGDPHDGTNQTGGSSDEDSAESEAYDKTVKALVKQVDENPQLSKGLGKSILGDRIKDIIGKGNINISRDEKGRITGVYHPHMDSTSMPGLLGLISEIGKNIGIGVGGQTYTGYGDGAYDHVESGENEDEGQTSKMIKEIIQKKKDSDLTDKELDYYGRGM